MQFSLEELAAKLGATVARGDRGRVITGVASLDEANGAQLAPFTDPNYLSQLKETRSGAVLGGKNAESLPAPAGVALLSCEDPELAFLNAVQLFHPDRKEPPGVDPRAVVEPGAELGAGVYVGPFAVLRTGARIGAGSEIMAHATIGRDCTLGENCRIHPHATLYASVRLGNRVTVHAGAVLGADGFGYRFRNGRHVKIPQVGSVEIGDDVEIGANTCIDRGALGPTRIGFGSKIDNLVQIGHNVRIGQHCILCGQAALAGSSGMDDYAMIGGNVGIADHVVMGKGSRAGAKSGIGKDVPPGVEVWGMFAEERTAAFKQLAATRRLPALLERVRKLEKQLEELAPEKGKK